MYYQQQKRAAIEIFEKKKKQLAETKKINARTQTHDEAYSCVPSHRGE